MKLALSILALAAPFLAQAQGTAADYQRSKALADRYRDLAVNVPGPANWIGTSTRFWYRRSVRGGGEFVVVDAATLVKGPAFDHEKLAASLSKAAAKQFRAVALPFEEINYLDNETAISFIAEGSAWRCTLDTYNCRKTGPAPAGFGRGGRGGAPSFDEFETPSEPENDVTDGMVFTHPQQAQGGPVLVLRGVAQCAQEILVAGGKDRVGGVRLQVAAGHASGHARAAGLIPQRA